MRRVLVALIDLYFWIWKRSKSETEWHQYRARWMENLKRLRPSRDFPGRQWEMECHKAGDDDPESGSFGTIPPHLLMTRNAVNQIWHRLFQLNSIILGASSGWTFLLYVGKCGMGLSLPSKTVVRVNPLPSPSLTIISLNQFLPRVLKLLPQKSWLAEMWFVSHQQQFIALLKSLYSSSLVMQLFHKKRALIVCTAVMELRQILSQID